MAGAPSLLCSPAFLTVMAGLDPAIHDFLGRKDVDARHI
jgi:hypothetical protein